jgi:hypothetical protein
MFGFFIQRWNEIAGYAINAVSIIGIIIFIILDYRSLGKEVNGFMSIDEAAIFFQFGNTSIMLPAREIGHIYFSFQTDYPGFYGGLLAGFKSSPSSTLNLLRILHKGEYYTYSINLGEGMRSSFINMLDQYKFKGVQVDIQDA